MDSRAYRTTVRLDAGPSAAQPHGAGGILTWGTATTVTVLDYSTEYGTQEYRSPEEVFDPESMASAIGIPLTIDHPDPSIDEGLVTPDTYRELSHGSVVEVARRDNDFRVRVVLASREALDAYAAGIRELSMAYRSRYVPEPGVWEGPNGPVPYSGRQVSVRYNALAQVPVARAGRVARLDAAEQGKTMQTIKIRNLTRTAPDWVVDHLVTAATEHAKAIKSGQVRRDAIATEEVTLRGSTMTLPTAMVDAIEMLITGGAAPASEKPEPMGIEADAAPVPPALAKPEDKPRMDAAIDAAVARALPAALAAVLPKAVDAQVAIRMDALATRARVERLAAPLLGDAFDSSGKDEHAIAVAALVRVDSACRDNVERLAAAARGGDLKAAGRLEQQLEDAVRRDAASRAAGDTGLVIDDARRDAAAREDADDDAAAKARADAATASDPIADAKRRMNDRLSGKKPKPSGAAA